MSFRSKGWVVLTAALAGAGPVVARAAGTDGPALFEKRIRPLLAGSCYECHSAGSGKHGGGLALDTAEALARGGKSGPAINAAAPTESPLLKTLRPTGKNPPPLPQHRLAPDQIADLEAWIKLGTPEPRTELSPTLPPPISARTNHWAFQPVLKPAVPKVKPARWPQTPVDNFLLAKLDAKSLPPSPRADKPTLLRRLTFDLTGLPPTPGEVESFVQDKSPDAWAKVVDRLLASPQYGERWGRHWLDLVRYSDTAGDSADYPIPQAYLYRNHVIDAFNRDQPYDQFLREQIAGDLLPSAKDAEKRERIIATGFIALSRRFSTSPEVVHHLTIEDTLDTTSRAVLGLSLSCARCHDHKYDPITMRDYYALYGIFSSTRYPYAGSEIAPRPKDLVLLTPQAEADVLMQPFTNELARLDAVVARFQAEHDQADKLFRRYLAEGFSEAASYEPPPGQRALKDIKADLAAAKQHRADFAAHPPPIEKAFALSETNAANARIQNRGDPLKPGDEVPRGFLQVLGGHILPPGEKGSGRRQLADWLADAHNPLTPRVMVNRIWQHHFGRGLVATPSDFGARGRPPTHPELLDYLAARFIESGWSIKTMHKLIVLSAAYQQTSADQPVGARVDPNNDLLWKFNRRRLDAEEIRDAMLAVSGELDPTPGGPHPFPAESRWGYTQHVQFTAVYDTPRRSVYLMQQRIKKHPFLATFDGADANASTAERRPSTTPLQALFMMNDPFAHARAAQFAARLQRESTDPIARITRAHIFVTGRAPARHELWNAENYLHEFRSHLETSHTTPDQRDQQAWASFCRALLASNEFIFVD